MIQSQYMRIQTAAGGVSATPRQIVRVAHQCLSVEGKSLASREMRHTWLRAVLKLHNETQLKG